MAVVLAEHSGNQLGVAALVAFLVHRIDGLGGAKARVEEFIVESRLRQIEQRFEIGRRVVNRSRSQRDVVAFEDPDACQAFDRRRNVRAMDWIGFLSGGWGTE